MNQQTAAYNKALNLGDYSNPLSSQASSIKGYDASGAPIYETRISAAPQIQQLLENQFNLAGQGQGGINSALAGLGGLQDQYQDIGNQYGGVLGTYRNIGSQLDQMNAADAMGKGQDAFYKSATSYLDPQFAQQQESLEAKLAAQGLAPGSQAYNNALGNFQRDKAFAYNQAQNSAITQGQQLGLNQLQAQQGILGQRTGLTGAYGQSLNDLAGLTGQQAGLFGQQIGANNLGMQNLNQIASLIPGYSGVGQSGANAADIAGAMNQQYQGQLGAYNARQQSNNATTSSLAGLAGMAAMMFF